ncbi:MAG: Fur family transcriptional regulator [Armatimonadota bacterium]
METAEEKQFRDYLCEHGLKFTPERRFILREVFRIHGHFEADEVVMGMRQCGIRVSRASVYRTLPLLAECGLLRQVYSSEKHSHFEHTFGHEHHDHMICSECGAAIEFTNETIEELQERICKEYGFTAVFHKLEISGICALCSEKNRTNHPPSPE